MLYKIVIPGRPVPKERPRMNRQGKMYTPNKTKEYEQLVAKTARLIIPEPLKGDVRVDIKIYTSRVIGDLDNYIKSILDGLNNVAYNNDKQISIITAQRYISEIERAEIDVTEVQEGGVKHARVL